MWRNIEDGVQTDAELVQRVKLTNDPEAFRELYERHYPWVLVLCKSILRNAPANVEDAVQDAFLAAYCKIDSFRGDAKFGTWIHRIAINAALTHRGKLMKRDEISIDDMLAHSLENGTPLPPQLGKREFALEHFPERKLLRAALERLPSRHKTMIYFRDFLGFSYSEISVVVERDANFCKGQHCQAIKKLRRLLGISAK